MRAGVLLALLGDGAVRAAAACSCDGCPSSATVYAGLHKDLTSPTCPEGSVATLERLRSSSSSGSFKVSTSGGGSYVYHKASVSRSVACFAPADGALPLIGHQRQLEVTLNCESVKCDFKWDVQFGCRKTGVLLADAAAGGGVQVLSDVDDTIVCPNPTCKSIADCTLHGGLSHYLAGKDKRLFETAGGRDDALAALALQRLEAKEFYPGVAEFMLGLALGPGPTAFEPARPMLLSARPREASMIAGISQDSELNQYFEISGSRQGLGAWGANTDASMYGTLLDGTSFTEFGETKAKSFNDVSSQLPSTRFVFTGDNGQGDVCAAQSMLSSANGDRLVAIFIHTTVEPSASLTDCEDPSTGSFTLSLPAGPKVKYHTTHSEAAMWALEQGLISCCSAKHVHTAVQEWHECRCLGRLCPRMLTGVQQRATRAETLQYCEDVAAAQAALSTKLDACADCPALTPLSLLPVSGAGAARPAAGAWLLAPLAGALAARLLR